MVQVACSHTLSLPSQRVPGHKQPVPCGNQASHIQALVPYETSGNVSCRNVCWITYFFANLEDSKWKVKTDWEGEESSNRLNDLTTFNIRCYFISHNLNMLTDCLASKVVTITTTTPHYNTSFRTYHVPTFIIGIWSYGCSVLLQVLGNGLF